MKKGISLLFILLMLLTACGNPADGAHESADEGDHAIGLPASGTDSFDETRPDEIPAAFPMATAALYDLEGEDAVLYDAIVQELSEGIDYVGELMLPSVIVYGAYAGEGSGTNYVCSIVCYFYYDLEIADTPTYNLGSGASIARITISDDGACTDFQETYDGADNTNRINELCGPLEELAAALNSGTDDSIDVRVLTPNTPNELLAPYLNIHF